MIGSSAKGRASARRCSGDEGVAIIEAALIMPVFLVLVFGIFEYGVVFRDYLTAADATAEAAKIGSIQGPYLTAGSGKNADYQMLALIRQDMATIPADWIERIVIFEATAPTSGSPVDQVPINCIIGGYGGNVANKCNVYEPYDAFLAVQNNNVGYFNCGGGATRSCGYNPITRTNGPKWQDIDYLGVYMKVKRPMLTGVFGEEFETETASIVRLEPGQLE